MHTNHCATSPPSFPLQTLRTLLVLGQGGSTMVASLSDKQAVQVQAQHALFQKGENTTSVFTYLSYLSKGRGNSTVVSVSVYQAGDPGSRPPRSTCHRKVEFYHCVTDSLPPVLTAGSKKAVHVLLGLCNNACKRSLAICRKSRAPCPVSRLLSVPI